MKTLILEIMNIVFLSVVFGWTLPLPSKAESTCIDATLGLDITVPDPKEGNRKMTLREVFQQQDWCIQVEPTQTLGKILFVTTKAQVSIGRRWIDENFDALFRIHLPRNPQFQQSTSIPHRLDKIPTSNSMLDYAKVLCRSISSLPSDPKSDKNMPASPLYPNAASI